MDKKSFFSDSVSRRQFIKRTTLLGLGAVGGFSLVGKEIAAAADAELVIGFSGGSLQKFHNKAVDIPFEKEFNCKITYDIGADPELIAKLFAEKDKPTLDCVKMDLTNIDRPIGLGIVDKFDQGIVTNHKDVHPFFKNDYWAGDIVATFGMTYNREAVKGGMDSWWDLWDPKLKGRVALPVFEWMGRNFLYIVNTIAGGTAANIDPGVDKLKAFVKEQNPIFVTAPDHVMQLFKRGEIWAAPFWDGRTRQLQDAGMPVEFLFPKEGANGNSSGFALSKGSKGPAIKELAQKYLNYCLDPDVQIRYCQLLKYPPTNVKAIEKLPPDLQRVKIPMKHMDNMLKLDYFGYSKDIDNHLERWNKEIATAA